MSSFCISPSETYLNHSNPQPPAYSHPPPMSFKDIVALSQVPQASPHGNLPDGIKIGLPRKSTDLLCGDALGPCDDDSWHRGMESWIVPLRPSNPQPCGSLDVFFFSKKGNAPGVSLRDAIEGKDIVEGTGETFRTWDKSARLIPYWPGYPHVMDVNKSSVLTFFNTISFTAIAVQVGRIMFPLLEECIDKQRNIRRCPEELPDARENAFYFAHSRVGLAGIDIRQVRLVKLSTTDGKKYWPEFCVVAPKSKPE